MWLFCSVRVPWGLGDSARTLGESPNKGINLEGWWSMTTGHDHSRFSIKIYPDKKCNLMSYISLLIKLKFRFLFNFYPKLFTWCPGADRFSALFVPDRVCASHNINNSHIYFFIFLENWKRKLCKGLLELNCQMTTFPML